MNHINRCTINAPPLAYVCCGGSEKVAIVNVAQAQHIGDISCGTGSDPYYIALHPTRPLAYVADLSSQSILLLDLSCNQLIGTHALNAIPHGLDVSTCGMHVYVIFSNAPMLQVLSWDLQPEREITLPAPGGDVQVISCGMIAYISQPMLQQTIAIDLCSGIILRRIPTGLSPGRMAYAGNTLLVAGRSSHTLTPLNTAEGCRCKRIPLDGTPAGLSFLQGNVRCLVALQREALAAVVDSCTRRTIALIPVGQLPGGVAASAAYPLAIVCNQISSTVTLINTQTLSAFANLSIGEDPVGVAISA